MMNLLKLIKCGGAKPTHYIYVNQINKSMFKNEIELRKFVTELANDYELKGDRKTRFINQVVDYGFECCKNKPQLLCFVDGLLMRL